MTEFVCTTQQNRSLVFRGPSGQNYMSYIGAPFRVDNKEDVAYFDKKGQFQRKKLLGKTKVDGDLRQEDEKFKDWLMSQKGVGEKTADKLVEQFLNQGNLVEAVDKGQTDGIPESVVEAVQSPSKNKESER